MDGQETEVKLVGNAMVAVELTEGAHTVTYKYHNVAFSLGWKVSLLCALLFAGLYVWYYKPQIPQMSMKHGKFEK